MYIPVFIEEMREVGYVHCFGYKVSDNIQKNENQSSSRNDMIFILLGG